MTLTWKPQGFKADSMAIALKQNKNGHYVWSLRVKAIAHNRGYYDRELVARGPKADAEIYKQLTDLLTRVFYIDIKFD